MFHRSFLFCTVVMTFTIVCSATPAQTLDWENPAVIGDNKLPPHATLIPFSSVDEALHGSGVSPWRRTLNGPWKFHWVKKPSERPQGFFRPDFDDRAWKEIPVPSDWQTQGFGTPIYSNITYPFPNNPPYIDHSNNPVGSAQKRGQVPFTYLVHL